MAHTSQEDNACYTRLGNIMKRHYGVTPVWYRQMWLLTRQSTRRRKCRQTYTHKGHTGRPAAFCNPLPSSIHAGAHAASTARLPSTPQHIVPSTIHASCTPGPQRVHPRQRFRPCTPGHGLGRTTIRITTLPVGHVHHARYRAFMCLHRRMPKHAQACTDGKAIESSFHS